MFAGNLFHLFFPQYLLLAIKAQFLFFMVMCGHWIKFREGFWSWLSTRLDVFTVTFS